VTTRLPSSCITTIPGLVFQVSVDQTACCAGVRVPRVKSIGYTDRLRHTSASASAAMTSAAVEPPAPIWQE